MEKLLRDFWTNFVPRYRCRSPSISIFDEFEFKDFIVEAFFLSKIIRYLFFFFKLMDIDVNKVSQEFVESITLSLSQMNFLIFLFFFSPFFVSKSYLKNKFIE